MSKLLQPPVMIELPPFVHGDSWDGVNVIGPITFNDGPPPTTLASVLWHFRRNWNDFSPAYVLSSAPVQGQGSIQIVDANLWQLHIPTQALPLPPGTWYFDLQLTDSAGTVFTPVGGILAVARDYTHT